MMETLGVPERDRFQVITEHLPENFDFNRSYLDISRSDRFVLVEVTLSAGRTENSKQAFYARLAELLIEAVALRAEDLAVVMVENERVETGRSAEERRVTSCCRASAGVEARSVALRGSPQVGIS